MKKPYLLIVGDQYYPSHDTGDWVACFETYGEALDRVTKDARGRIFLKGSEYARDWFEIVDLREWTE